jgi:hypothetical protein
MTGVWYSLTTAPPILASGKQFYADSMLLLTDGSVLISAVRLTASRQTPRPAGQLKKPGP